MIINNNKTSRISISDMSELMTGGLITTQLRLTSIKEIVRTDGGTRMNLQLEDSTGQLMGFVWPEHIDRVERLVAPTMVQVMGQLRWFDHRPQLHLQMMTELSSEKVICASELLPLSQCPNPARPALQQLVALERSLPWPFSGFLCRVLSDPAIGIPFMRCRASVNHHHAQVGGLLMHSIEQIQAVEHVARSVLPDDETAPYIASIGYLFHDLGKLYSVGECRRPQHPFVLRHETWTMLILAPHLAWLKAENPEVWAGLAYTLDYLATPPKSRQYAKYLVAEIVCSLDQWSAAGYSGRALANLVGLPNFQKSRNDMEGRRGQR